ncbi:1 25-dihydroxyvitamin D(3) 24-hydroxylase mitochondrial [Biomphalaria glabrata]
MFLSCVYVRVEREALVVGSVVKLLMESRTHDHYNIIFSLLHHQAKPGCSTAMLPNVQTACVALTRLTGVTAHWNRPCWALRSLCSRMYRVDSQSIVNGVTPDTGTKFQVTRSIEDIPGPTGLLSVPVIGSLFLYHPFTKHRPEKSHLLFLELYQKYGPIVKFRRGWKWSILLFDPDLIEESMAHEGPCPYRPSPPLYDAYSARTGRKKGISQVQGEEWLSMRRPFQEFLLLPANYNMYIPVLDEVSTDLLKAIQQTRKDDGQVWVENLLFRYAIESSAMYCTNSRLHFLQIDNEDSSGTSPDSLLELTRKERDELLIQIRKFMASFGEGYYTFPWFYFFETKLYKDFETALKYTTKVIHKRLALVKEAIKTNEKKVMDQLSQRPNLLQVLLSDGRLDFDTTVTMLTSFFTAATDNVSRSLALLVWQLAKNQSKQEALRAEIFSKIDGNQSITAEKLSHMPYLKACLKESHRITFPTPIGTVRIMPEDINLAGYNVPSGTLISYGFNVLGHCDKYFDDPEEFRPERWLKQATTDAERSLKHKQAIISMPFGFGKRNCAGRRLAEQQIYMALIKILMNYKLVLADPEEKLDVVYKITAFPSKPLDIRFMKL